MINNIALKSCNKTLTNYNNAPTYNKTYNNNKKIETFH